MEVRGKGGHEMRYASETFAYFVITKDFLYIFEEGPIISNCNNILSLLF